MFLSIGVLCLAIAGCTGGGGAPPDPNKPMYGLYSGKLGAWTVPDSQFYQQTISIRLTEYKVSVWIKDVEFPARLLEINPTKVRFTFRMINECEYECSAVRTGSELKGTFECLTDRQEKVAIGAFVVTK